MKEIILLNGIERKKERKQCLGQIRVDKEGGGSVLIKIHKSTFICAYFFWWELKEYSYLKRNSFWVSWVIYRILKKKIKL